MAVRGLLLELAAERPHDRWSGVNAAVNAIYLALGLPQEQPSDFERAVRSQSEDERTNRTLT